MYLDVKPVADEVGFTKYKSKTTLICYILDTQMTFPLDEKKRKEGISRGKMQAMRCC